MEPRLEILEEGWVRSKARIDWFGGWLTLAPRAHAIALLLGLPSEAVTAEEAFRFGGQSAAARAADVVEQLLRVDTELVQRVSVLLMVDPVRQLSVGLSRLLTTRALLDERQNHVLWDLHAAC
jgi:hypothetical protein